LGVWDEIAALEWVQANIGSFGGDKEKVTLRCNIQTRSSADSQFYTSKVTIFGASAGAAITSILFLDPGLGKLARAGVSRIPYVNAKHILLNSSPDYGVWGCNYLPYLHS
jgi:acetyl esterase/lipase